MAPGSVITYRTAGVDVEKGNRFVQEIKELVRSTFSPGVLTELGGFSGLFSLDLSGIGEPVLVATTDGVGTKLKIAQIVNHHETIGIDLVAMCANDLITCGARPLFFLDYFATGRLELEQGKAIIAGIVEGCRQAHMALIAGETAEMPGVYEAGEYDLAGFAVGIVDRSKVIDPNRIEPGDRILGIPASGLHSNGYSLVRKVLLEMNAIDLTQYSTELSNTFACELLKPTRIYVDLVQELLGRYSIKGISHITGGGFPEKLGRILPKGCQALIDSRSWSVLPIFRLIQTLGQISTEEMFRTFNMGIGMALVTDPPTANSIVEQFKEIRPIGKILEGEKKVEILY
jgi:phosphoribosylformylglycinamidine cyclo-ligase